MFYTVQRDTDIQTYIYSILKKMSVLFKTQRFGMIFGSLNKYMFLESSRVEWNWIELNQI